jgi:hypothetical protein
MDNKVILATIIGIVLGLLLYDFFLVPEVETKTEYVTTTQTKVERIPTLPEFRFIRSPKAVYLRDTIINEVIYPLNNYSGLETLKNGQIKWTAETSGFLNKINLEYEGEKEVITNTVTNTITKTNTILSKGLYLGTGINSVLIPNLSASYINNNYSFDYSYTPNNNIHSIGIKRKIF